MVGPAAQLQLSIDVASDPISGSISSGADDRRRFSGWIELVWLIEAVRTSSPQEDEILGWLPGANRDEV